MDSLSGGLGDDYLNTVDETADDYLVGGDNTDACDGDGDARGALRGVASQSDEMLDLRIRRGGPTERYRA